MADNQELMTIYLQSPYLRCITPRYVHTEDPIKKQKETQNKYSEWQKR